MGAGVECICEVCVCVCAGRKVGSAEEDVLRARWCWIGWMVFASDHGRERMCCMCVERVEWSECERDAPVGEFV